MNIQKTAVTVLSITTSLLLISNISLQKAFNRIVLQPVKVEPIKITDTVKIAGKPTINAQPITAQQPVLNKEKGIATFTMEPAKGLIFRVQILASKQQVPLSSSLFRGLSNVREYYADGVYTYTIGAFNVPSQSNATFQHLASLGFEDSFMVAFINDQPIPVKTAMHEIKYLASR